MIVSWYLPPPCAASIRLSVAAVASSPASGPRRSCWSQVSRRCSRCPKWNPCGGAPPAALSTAREELVVGHETSSSSAASTAWKPATSAGRVARLDRGVEPRDRAGDAGRRPAAVGGQADGAGAPVARIRRPLDQPLALEPVEDPGDRRVPVPERAVELAGRRRAGHAGEVGQHVHLPLRQLERRQLGRERLRDEVGRTAERLHNHYEIVTYVLVVINLPSSAAAHRATASSASAPGRSARTHASASVTSSRSSASSTETPAQPRARAPRPARAWPALHAPRPCDRG